MSGRSRTAAPRRTIPPGRSRFRPVANHPDSPASWRAAVVVFSVAALTRIGVAVTLWDLPLVRTPKLDSAEYLAWAQRLASGDWAWPIVAQHGPGYPLFLAGLLAATGGSLKAVMVLQSLVGAGTGVLIALAAQRMAGARAGLFAGLAYALYGPAVYIDSAILSEGLLLFLLALALWASAAERLDRPAAMIAGAAFGAAALVRPTALIVAASVFVWMMLRRRPRIAGAFALACIIVLTPALAKNWRTSGALMLQGYGGLNTYIGNSPAHDGRPTLRLGAGWDALNAEAPRAGIADPAAQDRYYLAKVWREIREQPAGFARLLLAKTVWMLQSDEQRDSHSYFFFTEQSMLLRVLPRWAILFPLACVGAIVLWRRSTSATATIDGARTGLLAWYTLGAAASVVLLVVGFRYRMPLVPALAIAAGAGVDGLAAALSAPRRSEVAALAGMAVAAVIVSHAIRDPRNTNLAEEWAFTGSSLITERRLGEAEAAYREALRRDPRSGLAWDGLGLAFYNQRRLGEARPAFERALSIDRENAKAIYHLALVDDREGRLGDAAAGYERARALSPFDVEVTRDLAHARRRLATELGMSGRTREAIDAMREVVSLTPENGEAWLDLCLLSLDQGDRVGAQAALARARTLGANPQRLQFALEALKRAGR